MEQQLNGPQREEAVAAVRQVARLADELAAVLRTRDYARLRDMMRNRHAGELAELLTELPLDEQVLVFRVMPRKDAATVFEYLSHDAKDALLKAMAQDDVAALLNDMAPDDRTMFLEELPATATRQLLGLLTPKERSVAVTLLGYPERSIGRLMTPHYVAVRETFTVREVLDYVRTHGQDSETLNVIYVVDEQGLLIDDVRIREFLLASVDRRVADLMDRRFVALKATDDQTAAVAVFRQYDRSALPVTDTTGMLIGIVTIDDVLDVAEATATREIQQIGGSEALDEPYMEIGFGKMIQKRAGWLTALFLGEMLTATAMASFEAEITKAVVLALFVPLIISSGGNSGSQAATLVIRALALGEVGLRDWWRVMRREIMAGLSLGLILGTIGFLRITLWSAFADTLRSALAAGRVHGGDLAGRRRDLGDADRIAAAVPDAPARLRSGDVVGAVRGHAGRRDRTGDLLQRRARASSTAHCSDAGPPSCEGRWPSSPSNVSGGSPHRIRLLPVLDHLSFCGCAGC